MKSWKSWLRDLNRPDQTQGGASIALENREGGSIPHFPFPPEMPVTVRNLQGVELLF